MPTVDLRSDTVTHPTPEMRRAMSEAEVGDDVFGEDPTVNALEAEAARRMGKEAALFVASGTMGNLVCALTHCQRGDEMIVGSEAHIHHHESGAVSALGSIHVRTVRNDVHGMLGPEEVEAAVRDGGPYQPRTALLCLENTHNRCSGAVLDVEDVRALAEIAHVHSAAVHMDGARIFNAAVALGVPTEDLARPVDSLSFCLSKGLSCPVGSLICGSRAFVDRARGHRRMVGGGMRQAGVLAAAGLVALDTMVERLAEDHANAKRLAHGLVQLPGIVLDPSRIQTNIVIFQVAEGSPRSFLEALRDRGLLVSGMGGAKLRMVTHYGIGPEHIDEALSIAETVARERSREGRR